MTPAQKGNWHQVIQCTRERSPRTSVLADPQASVQQEFSTVFAIAPYFSLAARQSAVSEHYVSSASLAAGTFGRTKAGCCPVGVLLRADNYGMKYTQPDSAYATAAILSRLAPAADRFEGSRRRQVVQGAVGEFINAFDAGEIHDLAEALGVETVGDRLEKTAPAPRKAATRIGQRP